MQVQRNERASFATAFGVWRRHARRAFAFAIPTKLPWYFAVTGDLAVDPLPHQAESAGGLAVNDIEGTLRVRRAERLVRPAKPRRTELAAAGVGEAPAGSAVPLLRDPVRMAVRDHLDVVARLDEPAAEIRGVALHPADPVHLARDGDDADPHLTGSASVTARILSARFGPTLDVGACSATFRGDIEERGHHVRDRR